MPWEWGAVFRRGLKLILKEMRLEVWKLLWFQWKSKLKAETDDDVHGVGDWALTTPGEVFKDRERGGLCVGIGEFPSSAVACLLLLSQSCP